MSPDHSSHNQGTEMKPLPLVPPGIPGDAVDMEVLSSFEALQTDDGSDLIVELIDLYLEDSPLRIASMREASLTTDWLVLKRAAHNLKGSSSNLGVRHVARTCEQIERIDHSSPGVEKLLQRLECEFAAANEMLLAERHRRLR